MYDWPKSKELSFAPNVIGESMAYVVSQIEEEEYVYDDLKVYEHGWRQGCGDYINYYDAKAIVKKGFSQCLFCLNSDSPWILARLAHILECTRQYYKADCNKPVSFVEEFNSEDCIFPYLNDFMQFLENAKSANGEITKEIAMELAIDFATKHKKENTIRKVKSTDV